MTEKTIQIYDFDGTVINSMGAILECQINSLVSATKKPREEIVEASKSLKLEEILSKHGMTVDEFFKKHYKTFDPFEEKKKGNLYVFPDAEEVLAKYKDRTKIVISNSSIGATHKKLDALDLTRDFSYVFAEFEKGKSKPSVYMGERALEALDASGKLSGNPQLLLVGDDERDIKFGEAMKSIYKNTCNILIKREGEYTGQTKPDAILRSLIQIGEYD